MCVCAPPRTPVEGVTIYARDGWPDYLALRSFFEDRGVLFEHEDIDRDLAALERMRCLSGQIDQAVVAIGSKIFVGFRPAELERTLPPP